jgi:hypothetical protein
MTACRLFSPNPPGRQGSALRTFAFAVFTSLATSLFAATAPLPKPVRVADVIDGHVHPSLCVAANGDVIAVYNKQGGGGKELLLCRSSDGGRTWTAPKAIPGMEPCSIYPGSLSRLSTGRLVLQWSCYHGEGERLWRQPQFSTSDDNGHTWTKSRDIPLPNLTNYSCLRHPLLELAPNRWVLTFYDRTVVFEPDTNRLENFGDGRDHGMVPIVRTPSGALVSGAPIAQATLPVSTPVEIVRGLRSTDQGRTWQPLHALPTFGVAGYDLIVLKNGWLALTSIIYGIGQDGEWAYEVIVSRDDGRTWNTNHGTQIFNPGRRIMGRGWPRSVQVDDNTLGTLFYDLDAKQPGGPGLFFVRTPISALTPAAK